MKQLPITNMLGETSRRRGEVLYFTDVGRSAMTCDTCHPDGHTGGILFEKTVPMRIYRSTTVRGSLETPPYFTPASQKSLGDTAAFVMTRNRFQNPVPTPAELDDVVGYNAAIPTLPRPVRRCVRCAARDPRAARREDVSPAKGRRAVRGQGGLRRVSPGPAVHDGSRWRDARALSRRRYAAPAAAARRAAEPVLSRLRSAGVGRRVGHLPHADDWSRRRRSSPMVGSRSRRASRCERRSSITRRNTVTPMR